MIQVRDLTGRFLKSNVNINLFIKDFLCMYLMFMIEASIKYVVNFINKLTAMKVLWAIFFIMF